MVRTNHNRQNTVFSLLVIGFTIILAVFIFSAVGMVILRGLPGLSREILSPEIWSSIKLSLVTSLISTGCCVLYAVPVAYTLSHYSFRGKKMIGTLLSIPLALPPLVSGVALLLLFGTTSWGQALAAHGIKFVFTPLGIILAQFFVNVPYMVKISRTTFDSIDARLEFIARTLGSTRLQAFVSVTIPLSFHGFAAGALITWARALGEFGAVLMLVGATRGKTDILPISLYLNMSTGDLDMALTSATILIIISVVSLFVFEWLGENGASSNKNRI
ncbi:MAG: ABC transporter permease [Bacillota bacterium]|nr:ABC transporter permease [Bacillota bacterium]